MLFTNTERLSWPQPKLFVTCFPPSPSSISCFATSFLIYYPSACLQHPWESLFHSHVPPETRGETCTRTHTPALWGILTKERVPNKWWQHCCVLAFNPSLTFTHTLSHLHQQEKNAHTLSFLLISIFFSFFFLSFMPTNKATWAHLQVCEEPCGFTTRAHGYWPDWPGYWPFQPLPSTSMTCFCQFPFPCSVSVVREQQNNRPTRAQRSCSAGVKGEFWGRKHSICHGCMTQEWHKQSTRGKLLFSPHSRSANKS